MDDVLAIKAPPQRALEKLRAIAVDVPSLDPALDRLRLRFDALSEAGLDLDAIEFEASYGRTTLEYYDGFVFGFYAPGRPDLPSVASGGRYDALTRQLGGTNGVPAVGGVVRPGLVRELRAGQ